MAGPLAYSSNFFGRALAALSRVMRLATLLFCSLSAASPDLRPFFEAASAGAQQLTAMLECKDENDGCASWAAAGECKHNPGFMHATCRKACERCDLSGTDAHDALEIATYAARNLHAGCTAADPPIPCAASADRLAAVLAVATQGGNGKSLQRFLQALAFEINADSASHVMNAAPGVFVPGAETDLTRAASIGKAATVNHGQITPALTLIPTLPLSLSLSLALALALTLTLTLTLTPTPTPTPFRCG